MKTLSLKLDDNIFNETELLLVNLKTPRNRYINEALIYYNKIQKKTMLSKQLAIESKLVKDDSIRILHEFENTENNEH